VCLLSVRLLHLGALGRGGPSSPGAGGAVKVSRVDPVRVSLGYSGYTRVLGHFHCSRDLVEDVAGFSLPKTNAALLPLSRLQLSVRGANGKEGTRLAEGPD